ncbi:hypothetical protein ACOMHN_048420 [Nucella lapillus]
MDRWIALSEIDKSFDGLVDLFLSEQLMQSVSKDLKTFLCEKNLKSFPEKITAAESYRVAHPEKVLSRKSDGSSVYASVGMQESVEEEEIESAAFSGYYQSDRSRPRFKNFGALDRGQRGGRNVRRGRGFNPNQFREPYNSADFTSYRDTGSYQNRDFRDRRAVDRGQFGSSFGRGAGNQQGVGRGAGNYQRPGGSGSGMFCPLCRKQGHTSITCRFGASNSAAESCSHCGLTHIRGYCVNRPGSYAGMSCYQESEDADCEAGCCSVVLESVPEEAGVKHTVCSSIQEYSGCLKLESGKVNGTVCSVLRDTGATVCGVRKRLVCPDQYTGETIKCVSFGGRVDEFPLARVDVSSEYITGEIVCCVLEAPVADFIVGNISKDCEGVTVSAGLSVETAAAITRSRSRHVVEKRPLADLPQVLEVTPDELAKRQKDDKSLTKCFDMAKSGEVRSAGKTSHYYQVVEGILYRIFKKGTQSWEQVVVPTNLRSSVLTVSHDTILSGHCGARRTLCRLREKFDWPGVTVDVAKYVTSCDVCQRVIPKGKVPPVPLAPVPLVGVPFHRVAIDLVGPIKPASELGHRYILTLIDVATRYPEAIPMKDISSSSVAEALLNIFSRLGFPKEILSDQGSQFNSELMKEFHTVCGSKGVRTSPYHPQANGIVERFHGTMKAMLKKVVRDRPKDWHRYLPALLFACRELPSESTGFSPFKLLFGREVRGPVSLLQEVWTDRSQEDEQDKPLYGYIFDLKNRLDEVAKVAMESVAKSSVRGKHYFDRKARDRRFKEVGVVDDGDGTTELPSLATPMTTSTPDESIGDVKFDSQLSLSQRTELENIFSRHSDILTTKPGCFSDDLFLEIPVTTVVPVKRRMYDIPFSAKEIVEREVQTMLDLRVIERSRSPYSAPVVLVKKKDGSCRFCIDYRWLNKITVTDAEPIPDVEALFAALGGARVFTRIDLAKGYWQVQVLPEDRPKTAFATHCRLFQFVRMPFGLVSAPAVFARMMRMLHLEHFSALNFFDDILIHSVDWYSHLQHVEAVLECLRSKGLTARPSKIETGFHSLEFLGHVVGKGTLKPEAGKIKKIMQIPTPTTKKQVRALLGLLSFYRRYVPNFATLSAPLTDLTKDGPRKSRSIDWTPACAKALEKIQAVMSAEPVLLLPHLDEQFVLRTDASSVGLGAVLLQQSDGVLHPVVFASRKLLEREKNYSTIERECLAIIWAVQKFMKFLWGVHFILQTDHRPLTYLRTSGFKNARILRWALSLQEFSFEIQPISGTSNVLADLLSRSEMDQFVP